VNQPDESLTSFERELTRAMRRVDPPEGFADRVMGRADAPSVAARSKVMAKVIPMPRRMQAWAGGAVAATLLASMYFGEQTHLRHQRERAQLAQRQFDTAMRITDQTLEHVRLQLQQAGVEVGN